MAASLEIRWLPKLNHLELVKESFVVPVKERYLLSYLCLKKCFLERKLSKRKMSLQRRTERRRAQENIYENSKVYKKSKICSYFSNLNLSMYYTVITVVPKQHFNTLLYSYKCKK